MTTPTEDEVRAWLEAMAGPADPANRWYRAALALLDEARKDRTRLDSRRITMRTFNEFGEQIRIQYCDVDLRAAIDQTRGA